MKQPINGSIAITTSLINNLFLKSYDLVIGYFLWVFLSQCKDDNDENENENDDDLGMMNVLITDDDDS